MGAVVSAASFKTHTPKPSATSILLQQPQGMLRPDAPSDYSQTRGKGKNKQRCARGCTQAMERQSVPEDTGLMRPWGLSGRNHNPVSTDPPTLPALPRFSLRVWQGLKKCRFTCPHRSRRPRFVPHRLEAESGAQPPLSSATS